MKVYSFPALRNLIYFEDFQNKLTKTYLTWLDMKSIPTPKSATSQIKYNTDQRQ